MAALVGDGDLRDRDDDGPQAGQFNKNGAVLASNLTVQLAAISIEDSDAFVDTGVNTPAEAPAAEVAAAGGRGAGGIAVTVAEGNDGELCGASPQVSTR